MTHYPIHNTVKRSNFYINNIGELAQENKETRCSVASPKFIDFGTVYLFFFNFRYISATVFLFTDT
jgi:hypothetical protein